MLFFLACLAFFSIIRCERHALSGVGCEKGHTHCDRTGYKDINGLGQFLRETHKNYPSLTKIFSIGKSEEGREILVFEISNKPGDKTEFEPNLKFIANLHGTSSIRKFSCSTEFIYYLGDENVGTNVLIQFIEYILINYNVVPRIKKIIDSMHLFFALTVNPDGYVACKRENSNGIDLNRNLYELSPSFHSFVRFETSFSS